MKKYITTPIIILVFTAEGFVQSSSKQLQAAIESYINTQNFPVTEMNLKMGKDKYSAKKIK